MNTVYIIAAIIFVLIFFRISKLLSLRNRVTQKYIPLLSALELILWTTILFWSVNVFFSEKSHYSYLIIILVIVFIVLLVWFYIKDIVAGFLFRVRHNPIKGQILQYDKLKGAIRKIGLSQLTVETVDGQWRRVPYSSIVTQTLSLQSQHGLAPGETVITLKLHARVDPGHFERSVRETLALSSWCVASKPITVQPDLEEDNTVRISFFLLSSVYLSLAKDRLSKLVNKFQEKG